jgi:hypothetical protein
MINYVSESLQVQLLIHTHAGVDVVGHKAKSLLCLGAWDGTRGMTG